jgi:SAM-dependent methyltransferase
LRLRADGWSARYSVFLRSHRRRFRSELKPPGNEIQSKNAEFFAGNRDYADNVGHLDTYKQIRAAIDGEVAGIGRLLDVGNGGVFEYDISAVGHIVAVDLFVDEGLAAAANVEFRRGDALALDEPPDSYDAALYALVFHHLTGDSASSVVTNTRQAIGEAHRVLRPNGRLIVAESCVPSWFYRLERKLFAPLAALARTRFMKHPPTLQLTATLLRSLIAERFVIERCEPIPVGRWIIQFGFRWPTALTPARPVMITARKT